MDNLEEMEKFLERHNITRQNQEERDNLSTFKKQWGTDSAGWDSQVYFLKYTYVYIHRYIHKFNCGAQL